MSALYEKTVERFNKFVVPTYAPKQLFVRGEGARLWDDEGREFLDFASGISVCNVGHCNKRVAAAIAEQSLKLVHTSNLYFNELMPRLAEKLITESFPGKVFFSNSGAEANEGMIKLARKYGNANGGRNTIISMDNSFHGRTLATLAATGRAKYRKGFEPDVPGFKQVPFNDIEALKAAMTPDVCGVMLEMVQGEGGILPADVEYLKQVRELCDKNDVLMLCDEVQCGMGRIGTRFAYQSFGVVPDAISMAKAIANGYPMGGFIVRDKFADVLTVGTHASTFGGTPLACAAALAVQQCFDEDGLLENCRTVGAYLMDKLAEVGKKYNCVQGVRGKGLMIGVVLDRPAAELHGLLLKENLVTLTAGETVLRLLPPLVITKEDADFAIEKIDKCLGMIDK
ncbi:MAG: aspartate aminotransferase family protein [Lentisphaeria bacterium]|nr:aspartate aminotransferase family protein [Lentisphaeria bacterium]MBR7118602.1 aspartate aminotransferase family protein [Lentisphaeria bacterium]